MDNVTVLSVGGSIISPEGVDTAFIKEFRKAVMGYLNENPQAKLIMVTGGGYPARLYQNGYKAVCEDVADTELDEIGIAATRLNGALMKAVFADECEDEVVTNPTADIPFSGRILIAAGWKPGFSSDTDAVYLAKKFGADTVINLSNIKKVYTADPALNPDATPIDTISWEDFRKIVGDTWTPGKNLPFDPIASREAQEGKLKVICADGRNIENTLHILEGREFTGTVIG